MENRSIFLCQHVCVISEGERIIQEHLIGGRVVEDLRFAESAPLARGRRLPENVPGSATERLATARTADKKEREPAKPPRKEPL